MHFTNISIHPPIIAHRGASALAPENTLVAFKRAKECGIQWIEFDVTVAACGEVVVFHDDTLQRTTNGQGNIHEMSYQELKVLDAGSWFSSEFTGEKIPTLKQTLLWLDHYQMAANIEIKSYPGKEAWLVRRVLEEIESYANQATPLLMTSFSRTVLEKVRHHSIHVPLGLLMDEWDENFTSICDELALINVGMNQHHLTRVRAEKIKASGRLLFAYTVNDVLRAQTLFSWGVDAIFSDCAQELLSSLEWI